GEGTAGEIRRRRKPQGERQSALGRHTRSPRDPQGEIATAGALQEGAHGARKPQGEREGRDIPEPPGRENRQAEIATGAAGEKADRDALQSEGHPEIAENVRFDGGRRG